MIIKQKINKLQLFLPVSIGLIIWFLFLIAYMLITLVVTIIVNCFNHGPTRILLFDVLNPLLPIVLILDILISFNTGFIKNGKIIFNRKAANYEYIMTIYFYCDVIAFMFSILQIIFKNTIYQNVSIFNYIVFIKLTTAYYTDTLFRKYIIKSFGFLLLYEVVKNFIILALLSHIIGSFYFFIDALMYENGWFQTNQLWVFSSYAYQNVYTSQFSVQYTYAYYVACVTLSGTAYGDIVPLNPYQNLYIFGVFVFPMLIYSYVYSSIFTALTSKKSITSQIRKYKFLAKQYLKSLGVNQKIYNKILAYLEFIYKKNMVVDTKFIQDLAPTIKQDYMKIITKDKFQYDCFTSLLAMAHIKQDDFKQTFMDLIRQEYFPERFPLLTAQKLKMYYINTGKVVEVVELKQGKKYSKPKNRNSHVAKLAFFTNQISIDKLKYESNSFVISHSIDYKQFKIRAKHKNPLINQAFCLLQSKIIDQKQIHLLNQNCFFCDEITHSFKQCPQLNPQRSTVFQKRKYNIQQRKFFNRDHMFKRPRIQKKASLFIKTSPFQQYNTTKKRSNKIYSPNFKKLQQQSSKNVLMDQQLYRYLSEFGINQKIIVNKLLQILYYFKLNNQNLIKKRGILFKRFLYGIIIILSLIQTDSFQLLLQVREFDINQNNLLKKSNKQKKLYTFSEKITIYQKEKFLKKQAKIIKQNLIVMILMLIFQQNCNFIISFTQQNFLFNYVYFQIEITFFIYIFIKIII